MLVNQVREDEIQVVFRSNRRISGEGFRLDTTCFHPQQTDSAQRASGAQVAVLQGNSGSLACDLSSSHSPRVIV